MDERGKTAVQETLPAKRRRSSSHNAVSQLVSRRPEPMQDFGKAPDPSLRPRLMGWMVSFTKDSSGYDIQLREGRNVIGSDPRADIYIHNDRSISGNHAIIMCRDGAVTVRDNDSTNGTYVDDTDVFGKGPVELKDRSRLRLGDLLFIIHLL
jgi:hypothetical protein